MESHIQVKDLKVSYGKQEVLKNVNLEIPRNRITVIMGPSGCGKTTLLMTMNRFLELNEGVTIAGQVLVDGHNIYSPDVDVTEVRKRVGLLAQRPTPLPMSIFDNVSYGMYIHQMRKETIEYKQAVRHYLELAGLWDEVGKRLHDPATALSIGQQQRLCLARGLAVEPEIILGDEPTSALDPVSSAHIEHKLLELKEKYTTVVVTHTLRQAKRLADHVVFMYLGEVVEQGPAAEVFGNPREERTKQYLQGLF
jgi:phosphate transport system ATP-binding protein